MENLRTMFEGLVGDMGPYLVNLGLALAVLIVGWLLALIISKIIVAALRRTTIDNRIASWVRGGDESAEAPEVEPVIGRIIFWFLMIIVVIAFFQRLNLTLVAEPLQNLVDTMLAAVPRIIKAAILALVAWLLASGLRLVVSKALSGFGVDERLSAEMDDDQTKQVPVSKTLSEVVYWLVFLFFLGPILAALELQGLLGPVQGMVDQIIGALPNIFLAVVIFVVGWFVAKIIRRILSNLLAAVGLDSLGERVGLEKALGSQKLSGLIGLLVYTLILLVVLVLSLDALKLEKITRPASDMLDQILGALPGLFGAMLIIAVFFVVGRLLATLASNLLAAAGFDRLIAKLGFQWKADEGAASASELVGRLALVVIMLFAAVEALDIAGLTQLSGLVSAFIGFFFNILLGLLIFGLGLFLANLAAGAISASGQSPLLATVAKVAILILAGAMALRQMDVAEDIINMAFGLILGAAAVAAAVAFGIGGRDLARQELERWSQSIRSGSGRGSQ